MSQEGNDGTNLSKWRSHKEVLAAKIIRVEHLEPEQKRRDAKDTGIRWHLEGGDIIYVNWELVARAQPIEGDYFVQYADGYQSWSPARAFEEGYTKVE